MADNRYISQVFSDIISNVQSRYDLTDSEKPYYHYGHLDEIARQLTLRDENQTLKFKKYPLIALFMDIEEEKSDNPLIESVINPTLIIANRTNGMYTTAERETNVFIPILEPIYELLLDEMANSTALATTIKDVIPHNKTNRYYWGSSTAEGNTEVYFNDYIDAIELNFSELMVYRQQTCSTTTF